MRCWFWLLALLLMTACSSAPVFTDYDPAFPFAQARSYAWLENETTAKDGHKGRNDLMRDRLHTALEDQMRALGIRKVVAAENADLLLTFHMAVEEKVEVYDFHDHFGYYPCFSRGCRRGHLFYPAGIHHDHWESEYQEGRLVVDMISPDSRKLVWRGISERRIPWLETPEERRLFIVEIVGSVMRHFPPGRVAH